MSQMSTHESALLLQVHLKLAVGVVLGSFERLIGLPVGLPR